MKIHLSRQRPPTQHQLGELQRQLRALPLTPTALTGAALKDLCNSLEQLHASTEGLLDQSAALTAAIASAEAERKRYQELFDSAPDGYLATMPDGEIQEANRAIAGLIGLEPEVMTGMALGQIVQEQEAATLARLLRHVQTGNGIWGWEMRMKRADGTAFPALVDVTAVREDGRFIGLRWIVRDISELKRAEEARRQSEERFSKAFRANPVAVCIMKRTDRRILDVNDSLLRMLGCRRDDLIGRPVSVLRLSLCLDGQQTGEDAIVATSPQRELAATCETWSAGVRHLLVATEPMTLDGESCVLALLQDVTERARAQHLLKSARDQLEQQVRDRTAELRAANASLQQEIAVRERVEAMLRARVRQQEAVSRLGVDALAGKSFDELVRQAVELLADTLEVDYTKVLQLLPEQDCLLVIAGTGWRPGVVGRAIVPANEASQAGYTLQSRRPVLVTTMETAPYFRHAPLLTEHGVVSGISVIIHGRTGPFGVLCAHSKVRREFTEDDTHFLQGVANVLATALGRQQGDAALRQIEWLLTETAKASTDLEKAHVPSYGSLVGLNTHRELLDAVGTEVLAEIANGYLDLLDTSVAIFEKNGDYALSTATSGWCRFLDSASRRLCDTPDNRAALASGRWHCHESCWNEASRVCIETAQPTDIECRGGVRLYAVPIFAGDEIVGSINFGYGDPPREPTALQAIAERYGVTMRELLHHAQGYESRPPFIVDIAKSRLLGSARLIGTIVERKRFENRLIDTIIERKRAEAEQQKFVSLVENSSDFIAMASTEGRMLFVNAAGRRMIGVGGPEQIVGTAMSDYWTEETWRQVEERALPAVQTTGQWRGEGLLRHRTSPSVMDVEINLFSVQDPYHPDPLCLAMVQRDITERKKVERLKSEFISTVSHELRTPVTSITGALGLMAGGVAGQFSDRGRQLVDIAYRNSERLVRLVNDILDIDTIESNRMRLDLRPIDVGPLVQQAVEANRTFAAQYQVQLALEGELPATKIHVDADRLMQVLTNLISNAAKFSPPQSCVAISATVRRGAVLIAVTDHGPGIPEEFHSRIFEKFSQADASDSRRKGGTGLGLSIAKALTERLGGRITFDTALGRGTTFSVEFPEWLDHDGPRQ